MNVVILLLSLYVFCATEMICTMFENMEQPPMAQHFAMQNEQRACFFPLDHFPKPKFYVFDELLLLYCTYYCFCQQDESLMLIRCAVLDLYLFLSYVS